ncbi:MAG TPA: hypothetical protein VF062_26220 [Candidatus Limnocylindrales bacterium]
MPRSLAVTLSDHHPIHLSPHIAGALAESQAANAINAKHQQHPWLGDPVTRVTRVPNGRGWYQHFQHGSIYTHGSSLSAGGIQAFEVHGAIRDKWASLGWENSFLGFPVTDESPTPDGHGRFNHFQGGSIYWTGATGAWEVHGAIRDKWASLGWEQSYLGYPVSDELPVGANGRFSNFERGQIAWSPEFGAEVAQTTWTAASGGGLHPLGLPDGGTDPMIRRVVALSATINATDHETFGSNEHGSNSGSTTMAVTNYHPQELITLDARAGGEVRVELQVTAAATGPMGDVQITGKVLLFEGDSDSTDDLDDETPIDFVIPPGWSSQKTYTVYNPGWGGGDSGTVNLTAWNNPA